jgi:hypothetical protein
LQLVPKISQYPRHDWIDPPQKVAHRNAPFEVEQVKQLALINHLATHHASLPSLKVSEDGIMIRRYSRGLFQQHRSKNEPA